MTEESQDLKNEIAQIKLVLAGLSAYVAALPGANETATIDRANGLAKPLTNPERDVVGGESVIVVRETIETIFKAALAVRGG